MSKKDSSKKPDTREPWEQSIYEPENDTRHSRVEKRQNKKGNTVFLTILVVLLVMIIALPMGTYFYILKDKSNSTKNANTTPSSSLVESSSKESSTESEMSSSSQASDESNSGESTSTSSEEQKQDNGQAVYDRVLKGEGFQQIAERNGISIEELEQLNGISRTTIIQPGQELRVK